MKSLTQIIRLDAFGSRSLLAALALAALPALAQAQDVTATVTATTSSAPTPQIILVLPAVEAPHAPCVPTGDDTTDDASDDAIDDDLPPTSDELVPRPFAIGLSGLAGTREAGTGIDATWAAGLDLGLRLTPREDRWLLIDVSLRRITFGGAETIAGERFAVGASPAVSVGGRLAERIEVYGEIGVGLQSRFASQATAIGVAPFGGGGVRFWIVDFFSIAIEGALHVPATRGYLLGSEVFPQAAAVFQGGLALAFHVG